MCKDAMYVVAHIGLVGMVIALMVTSIILVCQETERNDAVSIVVMDTPGTTAPYKIEPIDGAVTKEPQANNQQ